MDRLIKIWVAEGLIKPDRGQSLEEVAESYVKEFVDRNLLLVHSLRPYRELSRCCVHDVVRELCIRISENENFNCAQRDLDGSRLFLVDQATASLFYPGDWRPSLTRPQIIFQGQTTTPLKSGLLRVLFCCDYTFRQVNLRFLFHQFGRIDTYKLPSSISLLWGLQTLVTSYSAVAPPEIWEMPQLRHTDMPSTRLTSVLCKTYMHLVKWRTSF